MKKVLLILLVFLALQSQGQLTNVNEFRVANASTVFGRNIPIGTKIYNSATKEYWAAIAAVGGTETLTSAAASFEKLNANVSETDPLLAAQNDVTHEPSGFEHPEDVVVTYNSTNRTITLTGNTTAFWRGDTIAALTSGWTSSAHTATAGAWYLYYNGSSFVWSQSMWTFDMVQIAFVNYNVFAVKETHGLMQYQTHKELHETIGTYLTAGGDVSDYTLNSTTSVDRRPLVSSTSLMDEDNKSTEPALTTESYTRYYLTSTGTSNYALASSDIVALSGNQPYYNQWTGSAWTQTLMSSGAYQAIWLVAIPVTEDATSQAYRYLWVQGQSEDLTLSTIQAQAPSSVSLGALAGLTPEVVFIGKIIIRYIGGNWQLISVEKLTGNKLSQTSLPAGNYLSIVRVNAPLSGNGTSTDPIVLDTTSVRGAATQGDLAAGLATKEPTLTKGNLTENVTGLEFDQTRQVIGGAATLGLTTGYVIPTTAEQTNWNSAYSNRITSLTTTGSSGAATLLSTTLNIPNYTLSGLGGQPQLNGTGFVKASGTTITYDNSTYLTSETPQNLTLDSTATTYGISISSGNRIHFTKGGAGGGTTTYALTMNNSGTGAASGSTFDGSVARTLSYNTLGAPGLAAQNTFTDIQKITTAGESLQLTTTNAAASGGGVSFFDDSNTGTMQIGHNNSANENYIWSSVSEPFKIGVANSERFRILTTGQLKLSNYTSKTSFTGTDVALLSVDASGNVLTTNKLVQPVGNGAKTASFTYDASLYSIGAYTLSTSNAVTLSIHNLSSGMQGTIFVDITTKPSSLTVNAYSDAGSTAITKVVLGNALAIAASKATSITYTCVYDGTNTQVYLVYGQE